jgi:HTH-type transcriptional regulator/antitoxin HigA
VIAQYDRIDVENVNDYQADPIEAIKFRVAQQGLTARDLEPFIGPSGRVSEVLNRKRSLSLRRV